MEALKQSEHSSSSNDTIPASKEKKFRIQNGFFPCSFRVFFFTRLWNFSFLFPILDDTRTTFVMIICNIFSVKSKTKLFQVSYQLLLYKKYYIYFCQKHLFFNQIYRSYIYTVCMYVCMYYVLKIKRIFFLYIFL